MHNRSFEVYEVENGYKIQIRVPKNSISEADVIYPDYEHLEYVASSKEEVANYLGKFLDHNEIKDMSDREIFIKPKERTLLGG